MIHEEYLSFLSMRAHEGYRVLGYYLFPTLSQSEHWLLDGVLILLIVAIYIGYFIQFLHLKKIQACQQEFSHSLIDLQEQERKRIAAELHDGVAQGILIIKNSALIGLRSKRSQSNVTKHFTEISKYASQTLEEIRKVSQNLRPVLLDRLGLTESLRHLVGTISASSSILTTASIDRIDNLLSKEAEINLFRIVQESLNNILKHSQATTAEISVKKETQKIRILIQDNGRGMSTTDTEVRSDAGIGLIIMAERIKMLDGIFQINSFSGSGTSIRIEIPCNHI